MKTNQVKNMRRKGSFGEDLAIAYLQRKNYRLVERNYYIHGGELDLITEKNGIITFVEVKLRTGGTFGTAAESVTEKKKQKLLRAVFSYLQDHPHIRRWQIDLIAIHWNSQRHMAFIQHHPNFFEA